MLKHCYGKMNCVNSSKRSCTNKEIYDCFLAVTADIAVPSSPITSNGPTGLNRMTY